MGRSSSRSDLPSPLVSMARKRESSLWGVAVSLSLNVVGTAEMCNAVL